MVKDLSHLTSVEARGMHGPRECHEADVEPRLIGKGVTTYRRYVRKIKSTILIIRTKPS